MKDLGRQESIFPSYPEMAEPQHEISIFVAPAFERFVESIDIQEIPPPYAKVATADATPFKSLFYPE